MKKTLLITLLATASIGAQAGIVTDLGSTTPSGNTILVNSSSTRSREVIRTITQQFVVGQSFTLPAIGAGDDYKLTNIYLKSASNEDFDKYTGNFEIRVFSGTSGSAVGSASFDLSDIGDGTTATDVLNNHWVKFTMDSGVTLTDGGQYSFLFAFDTTDADHKWGIRRDDTGLYSGGNQFEGTSYDYADWDGPVKDEWNGVSADANDDFLFALDAEVVTAVPEPAALGMVALAGALLCIRRFFRA